MFIYQAIKKGMKCNKCGRELKKGEYMLRDTYSYHRTSYKCNLCIECVGKFFGELLTLTGRKVDLWKLLSLSNNKHKGDTVCQTVV